VVDSITRPSNAPSPKSPTEKSFGPNHPEVAIGLTNLAELLCNTNRLAETEPLYRRTLANRVGRGKG
jgi:hypothetical protein